MNEILRLIDNQTTDEDKLHLLRMIYSCGFVHGKSKIDEEFEEAIEEVLSLIQEVDRFYMED